jgi:hypothetical protein
MSLSTGICDAFKLPSRTNNETTVIDANEHAVLNVAILTFCLKNAIVPKAIELTNKSRAYDNSSDPDTNKYTDIARQANDTVKLKRMQIITNIAVWCIDPIVLDG